MSCKCAVAGCKSREETVKFCFPRRRDLCWKWVEFCHNPTLSAKMEASTKYLCYYKICSLHFLDACFTNSNRFSLNRGSVPSLLPPSISENSPIPTSQTSAVLSSEPASDHHSSSSFSSPLDTSFDVASSPLSCLNLFSSSQGCREKGREISSIDILLNERVEHPYSKSKEEQIRSPQKKLKLMQKTEMDHTVNLQPSPCVKYEQYVSDEEELVIDNLECNPRERIDDTRKEEVKQELGELAMNEKCVSDEEELVIDYSECNARERIDDTRKGEIKQREEVRTVLEILDVEWRAKYAVLEEELAQQRKIFTSKMKIKRIKEELAKEKYKLAVLERKYAEAKLKKFLKMEKK